MTSAIWCASPTIGDLVRVADGCTCGRSPEQSEGYVLQRIEGRANDAVPTARGLLTPAMLDDLVDAAEPTVAQWQLQGSGTGAGWLLHVVGSDGAKAAAALAASLDAPVEARPTTTILPEPSGKYRIVRAQ
jgi:hypothetical protein